MRSERARTIDPSPLFRGAFADSERLDRILRLIQQNASARIDYTQSRSESISLRRFEKVLANAKLLHCISFTSSGS
jgi:hypothetical protein